MDDSGHPHYDWEWTRSVSFQVTEETVTAGELSPPLASALSREAEVDNCLCWCGAERTGEGRGWTHRSRGPEQLRWPLQFSPPRNKLLFQPYSLLIFVTPFSSVLGLSCGSAKDAV